LPKQEVAAGAGFSNLTRQLGGSIGIAVITTVLEQRAAFHKVVLLAHLSAADPHTQQRLSILTSLFQSKGADPSTAHQQAIATLEKIINQQVSVLAYADMFRLVGIVFLCSLPLILFLGKGTTAAKVDIGH
jgi:DHA2 family multidrug resistance protein